MKLYLTKTSAYARIVRVVIIEKALDSRVEQIVARTRRADSPYYAINPSGRVPYLILEDGSGLEESSLICWHLDHLDGRPAFDPPTGKNGLEARRLEALARSLLDGVAVWGREMRRPQNERSPTIVAHETARARRLADVWETQVAHPLMSGALNMAQITLVSALHLEVRTPGFAWREGHPQLAAWANRLTERPSIADTMPPS